MGGLNPRTTTLSTSGIRRSNSDYPGALQRRAPGALLKACGQLNARVCAAGRARARGHHRCVSLKGDPAQVRATWHRLKSASVGDPNNQNIPNNPTHPSKVALQRHALPQLSGRSSAAPMQAQHGPTPGGQQACRLVPSTTAGRPPRAPRAPLQVYMRACTRCAWHAAICIWRVLARRAGCARGLRLGPPRVRPRRAAAPAVGARRPRCASAARAVQPRQNGALTWRGARGPRRARPRSRRRTRSPAAACPRGSCAPRRPARSCQV